LNCAFDKAVDDTMKSEIELEKQVINGLDLIQRCQTLMQSQPDKWLNIFSQFSLEYKRFEDKAT
jgi:hypothetical protein